MGGCVMEEEGPGFAEVGDVGCEEDVSCLDLYVYGYCLRQCMKGHLGGYMLASSFDR